jgi:hypothetical protein
MFLPNGDSFTGEWRRGLIGGKSCVLEYCVALFVVSMACHATVAAPAQFECISRQLISCTGREPLAIIRTLCTNLLESADHHIFLRRVLTPVALIPAFQQGR